MTEKQESIEEVKRDRSPSTPFISLKKAVERADALSKNFKKIPARLSVVAQTWGYGTKSSGLLQTAAALIQYGLITNSGSGEDRKIQLTDLAWKILTDERPGEREKALREAALKPKLIAEYFLIWMDERPPEKHCISELTLDRGFNETAAQAFIKVYDETISFAGLTKDDTLSSNLAEENGAQENLIPLVAGGNMQLENHRPNAERANPPLPSGRHRATLPTSDGIVMLEIPEGLSQENGEFIQNWVELILKMHKKAGA